MAANTSFFWNNIITRGALFRLNKYKFLFLFRNEMKYSLPHNRLLSTLHSSVTKVYIGCNMWRFLQNSETDEID